MIALIKFVHISALLCWCAGLIALPIVLERFHTSRSSEIRYNEFRLITHYGYIGFATPAAVIAITAGTVLYLVTHITAEWLIVKLAFVSCMVLVHAWLGRLIQRSSDGGKSWGRAALIVPAVVALLSICLVFWLVLAKPDVSGMASLLPEVLLSPRNQSLPDMLW